MTLTACLPFGKDLAVALMVTAESPDGATAFTLSDAGPHGGYCHNAPSLAERPFSNYQNVAAPMRVRANLTGKEYAKLLEFLRRWNDIPPPTPPVEPSPKRLMFSQPIAELRKQEPAGAAAAPVPQVPPQSARPQNAGNPAPTQQP